MSDATLIVQPEDVHSQLDKVIVDVGTPEQYDEGHINGAVNLPYSEFVVSRGDVEGAIAEDERIVELFSEAGIDREKPIFVYDGSNNARACRLIWTLHAFNHTNASLIDGGYSHWMSKGYDTTESTNTNTPTAYTIEYNESVATNKNFVMEHILNSKNILLDTRSEEEYQGKKVVGKAKKAGHIPSARNINWKQFIDPDNFNRIISVAEIKKILLINRIVGKKKIVVYCQSHLLSSHTYVVLKSLGYDVSAYAGSWSQWSADASVEVNVTESKPLHDRGQGSDPENNLLPLIVSPEELKAKMGEKNLILVDLSLQNIYNNGHIPNAVRLNFPSILYQHDNCDCDIPSDSELSRAMAVLGLRPEHHVVAYDRQGGPMATRFLWTLEALGHTNYSYLNGGLSAWKAAKFDVSEKEYFKESTNYIAKRTDTGMVTKDEILSRLDDDDTVLLDVRLEEEFDNELLMCDRGGRIPGAKHMNWEDAVDVDNHATFRPDEELQKMLDDRGITKDKNVIVYCQTHTRSSHTFYVLKKLGYENLTAYPAAYSEWGNDPDVPIENEQTEDDE
ncbi:MAG: sulfurtransferase [Methylococcales bacterium]|jgi:thiosulfate/3-mercaptopyruvate sulfurtransferase|nr:sulfurtransferase [Methylococcales bacterium]MBT7443782.1 sulfurtransferase [Methylococcales bacterium]